MFLVVKISRSDRRFILNNMSEFQFIENPIVGKFYKVPCVRSIVPPHRWVAILPSKHSDPQFGNDNAAVEHYHFDLRFISNDSLRAEFPCWRFNKNEGRVNAIYFSELTAEIKILKRKCYREFTGVLVEKVIINKKATEWYGKQKGKSCAGRICPHFRQPMIERDGVLECPYHGLIGDIKTEKIIGNIHGI
jgi:hypothetical protein